MLSSLQPCPAVSVHLHRTIAEPWRQKIPRYEVLQQHLYTHTEPQRESKKSQQSIVRLEDLKKKIESESRLSRIRLLTTYDLACSITYKLQCLSLDSVNVFVLSSYLCLLFCASSSCFVLTKMHNNIIKCNHRKLKCTEATHPETKLFTKCSLIDSLRVSKTNP